MRSRQEKSWVRWKEKRPLARRGRKHSTTETDGDTMEEREKFKGRD